MISQEPLERARHAFIVGTPRGGTTWLCRVLNHHPQISTFGETAYWGRKYTEPGTPQGYTEQQVEHIAQWIGGSQISETDGTEAAMASAIRACQAPISPHALFTAMTDAIAAFEGVGVVVEKTPHHVNWHERITQGYEDVRFVVMLRRPYEFMLSYKYQGGQISTQMRAVFQRAYHPLACALVWRKVLRSAKALRDNPRARSIEVWTDQLQDGECDALDRVQALLGVERHPLAGIVPPANSSFSHADARELDPVDLFWMNLICGSLIRAYGIERRPTGFHPLRIAWSILRLPLWFVERLIKLRHRVEGSVLKYFWRWIR